SEDQPQRQTSRLSAFGHHCSSFSLDCGRTLSSRSSPRIHYQHHHSQRLCSPRYTDCGVRGIHLVNPDLEKPLTQGQDFQRQGRTNPPVPQPKSSSALHDVETGKGYEFCYKENKESGKNLKKPRWRETSTQRSGVGRAVILNALRLPTIAKSTGRVFGVCAEYSAASFTRVLTQPQLSIPRSNASNTEATTQWAK